MKKINFILSFLIVLVLSVSSCTSISKSMRTPNSRVDMTKGDFEFSEQVTGEASATYILMIDFERLFSSKSGNIETENSTFSLINIPVVGAYASFLDPNGQVKGYALHDMMEKNPGYDVVFYPQYEVVRESPIGIPFLFHKATVKATARLAKLKQ